MSQFVSKDWEVDLKWTIFWPTVFQGINKHPRYSAIDTKEVVMVVLTDFTKDEDAPKEKTHYFGESNAGNVFKMHEMAWSCRVGENAACFLFLQWALRMDEYFDITIGAYDEMGNYLGVWAPDTEILLGCTADSMSHAYAFKTHPYADVTGSFCRVVDAQGAEYGHGRYKALPSEFPWEKQIAIKFEGEGSEPENP